MIYYFPSDFIDKMRRSKLCIVILESDDLINLIDSLIIFKSSRENYVSIRFPILWHWLFINLSGWSAHKLNITIRYIGGYVIIHVLTAVRHIRPFYLRGAGIHRSAKTTNYRSFSAPSPVCSRDFHRLRQLLLPWEIGTGVPNKSEQKGLQARKYAKPKTRDV